MSLPKALKKSMGERGKVKRVEEWLETVEVPPKPRFPTDAFTTAHTSTSAASADVNGGGSKDKGCEVAVNDDKKSEKEQNLKRKNVDEKNSANKSAENAGAKKKKLVSRKRKALSSATVKAVSGSEVEKGEKEQVNSVEWFNAELPPEIKKRIDEEIAIALIAKLNDWKAFFDIIFEVKKKHTVEYLRKLEAKSSTVEEVEKSIAAVSGAAEGDGGVS